MKIAITGHTSGVGKALYNKLTEHGHDVISFSRSNGFDITDPASRIQIIETSKDVNVFINNAWAPKGQTELLKQLIMAYRDQSTIIVNISSMIGLLEKNIYDFPDQYMLDKKIQNSICAQSILDSGKLKILNVIAGLIDTPGIKDFTAPKLKPKLNPDQLADFLVHIIEHDHLFVHQLMLEVKSN
jgi:hypothetical protein